MSNDFLRRTTAILYPDSRQGTSFPPDPSQHRYSPLAQFSSQTLQEHAAAAQKLAQHREIITRLAADLVSEESANNRRHESVMTQLKMQETDLRDRLRANTAMRESLFRQKEQTDSDMIAARNERQDELQLLQDEDAELHDLEEELRGMSANAEARLQDAKERLRLFSADFERGFSVLQRDRQEMEIASRGGREIGSRWCSCCSGTAKPCRTDNVPLLAKLT